MLAANVCAAEYLHVHKHTVLYRIHQGPTPEKLEALREFMKEFGLQLGGGEEPQAADYSRLLKSIKGRPDAGLLQTVMLRSLRQAKYEPENIGHFGLGYDAYTHFTSPIRRYPDLAAHRALLDALGLDEPTADATELAVEAERSSMTERAATALERRADRVCLAFLLMERLRGDPDQRFEGEVTGIGEGGVFVAYGPDLAFDGYLPARRIEGDWWRTDPLGVMLIGDESGRRIAVGDAVTVRVVEVNPLRGRVDLEPADTSMPAPRPAPRNRRERRRR